MPKFIIEYKRKVYGEIEVNAKNRAEAREMFGNGDYDELTDNCTTEGAEIIWISESKKKGRKS